jgi:hypothetical protein
LEPQTISALLLSSVRTWTLPAKGSYSAKSMIEYTYLDIKSGEAVTKSTEETLWTGLVGGQEDQLFSTIKLGSSVPIVTIQFDYERKGTTYVEALKSIVVTGKHLTVK